MDRGGWWATAGCKELDMTKCAHMHSPSASQVAQMVKNLPAMLETLVQSLGQEDPLEKGILPGESHGQSSLAGYSPWGAKSHD